MVSLYTGRQEEWDVSTGIFIDEKDASIAVRDERIRLSKAAYAVKFTGLTAAFSACLTKASATGPLTLGAYLFCSGTYTASVAAAWNELRNGVADANSDFADKQDLAQARSNERDDAIKALYERLLANEETHHDGMMTLIWEDHRICVEGVSRYETRKEEPRR